MPKIVIHQELINNIEQIVALCPFKAIEYANGELSINAACKMCRICVKNAPNSAFEWVEDEAKGAIDKSEWKGISVYIESMDDHIHPVSLELIGKARELAQKINQPVYGVLAGHAVKGKAESLLEYGVDEVFAYDDEELANFRIEPYTAVCEDHIRKVKPAVLLIGGTNLGRSLAPRIAARFRTGLTADCTVLDIQENTDLDQIRPAFGGNIMAHIRTSNHRPQLATVRYKVFSVPEKLQSVKGKVTLCSIDKNLLTSNIRVIETKRKEKEVNLEDAEVIIVAGRGIRKQEDLSMIYKLAGLLNAQIAGTRPMIEAGWIEPKKQIGLSGRTVKPKFIITCGVSGAVQFAAGMQNSDCIIAINKDENAPIFNIAQIAIVGDIYEIIPALIKQISKSGKCNKSGDGKHAL